ncbi:MAG: asparagine synthase (glutamine-hydrolyzing), partial [Alphaproteobacteria bacterium]|nr:asparagine synthase (glutamine-hydrolyzing) [Alphaproteobacteria bacterium]
MCGINLIFGYGENAPPVDDTELYAVRESMIPRGPDEAGIWRSADRQAGFGHRRLSIIDLSPTGRQPMSIPDMPDSPVVVFNGEIYNFHDLRSELIRSGTLMFSNSDTEVLLHLYLRDGPAMVEKLRGMFAFAIWDPARRGMLLARDPLGIKPLYYADDGQTLRAASQVKALRAGGHVDTSPDPAGHAGFFLFGYVPDPHTLYRGIHALPAGTTLWCEAGLREEPKSYFDVARAFRNAPAENIEDRKELRARVRTALRDSIDAHMVADVPVGVFLSAGRDSTTIAALARQTGNDDLRTVTLGFREFEGRPEDETPLAEQVADALGATHETRWVARDEFARDRDRLFAAMDQPSIDGVNTYFVAKATAATGLKVALSGVGGDELFGGYPSFDGVPKLLRSARWSRRVPGLGKGFRILTAPVMGRMTSPKYAGLLEYGTAAGDAYLLRRALYAPWELPEVMDPDMAAAGWAALAPRVALARTADGHRSEHA